jgi:glycosyltransferase involved in cell wall biosynthesis
MTEFAENIIHLLSNPNYYQMLSKEAVQLINEQWDWEKQAQNIFDKSTSC